LSNRADAIEVKNERRKSRIREIKAKLLRDGKEARKEFISSLSKQAKILFDYCDDTFKDLSKLWVDPDEVFETFMDKTHCPWDMFFERTSLRVPYGVVPEDHIRLTELGMIIKRIKSIYY
jgi:hypothetical protein